MLLIFGDAPITTGIYSWQYEINADFDSTGFLGMMSASTTQFALQMYLNDAAEGSHFADPAGNVLVTFTLPEDQWVTHRWVIDLDAETVVVTQNEVEIYSGDFFRGALESCDIWDDDAASFYLDNVVFQEGLILSNNDFSADNFSVYPNPVRDVLNIQTTNTVDSVVVYDVLGKVVLSVQPDAISPRINMSELSSGAYMVNVTINGASKTVKVIK
jgi:hypothetical protein